MRLCLLSTKALPALLIVLLLVLVSGCGSFTAKPDEAIEPEPEEGPEKEDQATDDHVSLVLDQWQTPTTMRSIVANFARLEWHWGTVDDGEEGDRTPVVYIYEGTENVGGVETDKITLLFEDQEWKIWLDSDGNPKQASSGGEMIPEAMGQTMARGIMNMVTAPFSMVQVFSVQSVLRGTVPGWSYRELSRSREEFGNVSADVTRLEVTARPPAVAEGDEFKVIWGIADFGDFQMLVEWNIVDGKDGEHAFLMQIIEVDRR